MMENNKWVKNKILAGLRIYPGISHSMLGIYLGNDIHASLWRVALEELVAEEKVEVREETHESHTMKPKQYKKIYIID